MRAFWLAFLLMLACGTQAQAQGVRLVVPFAAGGAADNVVRMAAPGIAVELGQPVVVDNRGGAGGVIGSEIVAKAAPDGQTLLVSSLGVQVLGATLQPRLPYDPVRDFVPVAMFGRMPSLLVVRPGLAETLADLPAAARRLGRALTYGSAGPGTTMHIAGEMLRLATGLELTHIPYRGAGPAVADLLAGNIDLLIADTPVLVPQVQAGRMTAVAVLGTARTPLLPGVPTSAEQGQPGLVMENWYGVLAPSGLPPDRLQALERAIVAAMAKPDLAERFVAAGLQGGTGAEGFRAQLASDIAQWPPLLRRLNITLE
ncbi:Bug family tripartite tricarboxylate transporter substrate binding protein [Siccirubricoccus phaeus]|uniref:Bug family tripartite tricarboxylate transporter substrate binding protein n=1 Tax=Siccirubricoccus phaeus TaxID=2595053 RepID=UPI00165C9A6E|nr:tripartite tricarboxylate transporter substrate-binding protein [Siccirubricoccus phaeus]